MIKTISRFAVTASLFFMLSCTVGPPQAPDIIESRGERENNSPITERREPKRSDPVKQAECSRKSRSGSCEGEESCEEICDDIFSSRADRRKCYELPEDLVSEFETLLEATEDGDTDEIDPEILNCLLDIDEREFAKAIKKMSRGEAEDFLAAVAEEDYLAQVLEEEDDEAVILRQLLSKTSRSENLIAQLENEIEDRKSFFYLAAESNEYAWDWLDKYVDDVCSGTSSDYCPGGESIGTYCKVLLNTQKFSEKKLKAFLSDADIFSHEYEDDVEEDNYLYEVTDSTDSRYEGDFRDWCNKESTFAQPCPDDGDEPPGSYLLTTITPRTGPGDRSSSREFAVSGGACLKKGDNLIVRSVNGHGQSDPKQHILLYLLDYTTDKGEMVLNNEYLNYKRSKKYYLYIDDARYELQHADKKEQYDDNCTDPSTTDYRGDNMTLWQDFLPNSLVDNQDYKVWLASEENDRCTFYTPRTKKR